MALANLELAFPERSPGERSRILAAHYRDLGMMMCEAARGAATSHAPAGEVVGKPQLLPPDAYLLSLTPPTITPPPAGGGR